MKDLQILFSAPMVRAILAGTKTQTRRAVKPCKDLGIGCELAPCEIAGEVNAGDYSNAKYHPGDRLWVRETFAHSIHALAAKRDEDGPWVYAATDSPQHRLYDKWNPSIFMPRAASRITLEVTSVRVERLQGITADDAMAEGIVRLPDGGYAADTDGRHYHAASAWYSYGSLWEHINGPGSWELNPWVWVVEFKRVPQ